MMLDHLGQQDVARRIHGAVDQVVVEGRVRTRDMGGQATTEEFTEALVRALEDPSRGEAAHR
jgi:isocitrate/isopropylmalate dehydrogenase